MPSLCPEPARIGSGSDDDTVRLDITLRGVDDEGPGGRVHSCRQVLQEDRSEAYCLSLHKLHHAGTSLIHETRVILHIHALAHELASEGRRHDYWFQSRSGSVDGGSEASG